MPVPSRDYLYLWQQGKEPGPKLHEKHQWWNLLALPLTIWHWRDSHWPLKLLSRASPEQFLKGQRSSGNAKSKTWGKNCTRQCFLCVKTSVKMMTAKPGVLWYNFFFFLGNLKIMCLTWETFIIQESQWIEHVVPLSHLEEHFSLCSLSINAFDVWFFHVPMMNEELSWCMTGINPVFSTGTKSVYMGWILSERHWSRTSNAKLIRNCSTIRIKEKLRYFNSLAIQILLLLQK